MTIKILKANKICSVAKSNEEVRNNIIPSSGTDLRNCLPFLVIQACFSENMRCFLKCNQNSKQIGIKSAIPFQKLFSKHVIAVQGIMRAKTKLSCDFGTSSVSELAERGDSRSNLDELAG